MNTVKAHYDNQLGSIYSWMMGDFEKCVQDQRAKFQSHHVQPKGNGIAIDLGAGHGIQSVALDQLGFKTLAVEFCSTLILELEENCKNTKVKIINDDIKNVLQYKDMAPELICCCGDTISHLNDEKAIEALVRDAYQTLGDSGLLYLSFRDYATPLEGVKRFIPVKSDENRILTCILEYGEHFVNVTDQLYQKENGKWELRMSEYRKVRISVDGIATILKQAGFSVIQTQRDRMNVVMGKKP